MSPQATVIGEFRRRFGADPQSIANAPGRVNLIGEHTDYNDGLVLPFAIDRALHVAAGLGRPGVVTVHSLARGETVAFPVNVKIPAESRPWQNYVRGVVFSLRRAGIALPGVYLCIGGDLAVGGGLSSSAALSVACTLALASLAGAELAPREVAFLAQGVEHEFAGTQAGIMDPYVSVFGRDGHAVLIDCRSGTHEYVPLHLGDARLLVIDSGIRHALAQGAYLQRVLECRRALSALATLEPAAHSLRDVSEAVLDAHRPCMDSISFRRARHVVSENHRVLQVVAALAEGRVAAVGELLREGHRSLRDDYEVSCPEIEEIIDLVDRRSEVLGARMIGGGFGGMVLVLTQARTGAGLSKSLDRGYNRAHPTPARVLEVQSRHGAARCALD